MEKVKGIGLPFDVNYSSCSSRKPRTFEWTTAASKYEVYIDNAIELGLQSAPHPNKYGWLCESMGECPTIRLKVIENLPKYKEKFRAIFTCEYDLLVDPFFKYSPPGSNLPWTHDQDAAVFEKTKICSMICSPKSYMPGQKLRLEVAKNLKDTIDLFGGAHGSPVIGSGLGPKGEWWRSKLPGLADYRFSVVFENAVYDKYYTEKITDCFATGTVPIYYGTRKISDDFNSAGIIFWEDFKNLESLTTDLYNSMLGAVKDNFERVKNLKSADDQLFQKIQEFS
jgi:hypothetical protein